MSINMNVKNIKSIKEFEFNIPMTKGLYAITGENGTGKSTIMMAMSTSFYNPMMYHYFGTPMHSSISFQYKGNKRNIRSKKGQWFDASGHLGITGFYEGSLTFGNRFKDVDFKNLKKVSKVKESELEDAPQFVKDNLGEILRDDKTYYKDLRVLGENSKRKYDLMRALYYNYENNRRVNQLHMSTGENLLLSILQSLHIRISRENYGTTPALILLDEIELALHSSALRRLVFFLERLSEEHNFVVIFSTHSIELIRNIDHSRIYFLQRHTDKSIEVINPCYPVYATRNLESSNYGHDYIFVVEDNLAQAILNRILYKERLLGNKRVLVIPVGGWAEVIRFTYDMIKSNLTLNTTKIMIVLDRDIKGLVPNFMNKNNIGFANPPHYLPIKSLEKYLVERLVLKVDHCFFRVMNDYVFQNKSLSDIVSEYQTEVKNGKINDEEKIKNGKAFYSKLQHELRQMRKLESVLSDSVVEYLFEKPDENMKALTEFLCTNLSN
ncbi:AAA family ATPase [Vallitaleaceae bacterium 9-2]